MSAWIDASIDGLYFLLGVVTIVSLLLAMGAVIESVCANRSRRWVRQVRALEAGRRAMASTEDSQ